MILLSLLENVTFTPLFENGDLQLELGAMTTVAARFGVSRQAVARIWKRGKESVAAGAESMVVDHRKSRCGRKKKDHSVALQNMSNIPINQRKTIRSTAHALGVSTWAVWSMTKRGGGEGGASVRRHSSSIRPMLTDRQKQDRIDYSIRQIDLIRGCFKPAFDVIHVDEKWFYMKKLTQTVYLAPGEEPPERSTKSKRFVQKVMFLCAVARPRHDTASNTAFDGKIGIWPFTELVPAQRNSRNRPAGTMELKNLVVTKEVYKQFIVEKLIPAIELKWPQGYRNRPIRIQQDNARPHGNATNADPALAAAVEASGLDVRFENQPANSPDTNILDLGFFNSIQCLQQSKQASTIPQLVDAVTTSFEELSPVTLNKCFLSHQNVCREIVIHAGGNGYKLPHMSKEKLRRNDSLPLCLPVDNILLHRIHMLRPNLHQAPAPVPNAPAPVEVEVEPEEV